jgi:asparagine synthase (glutamine-hydrolysing)
LLRYVAVAWDPHDPAARRRAESIICRVCDNLPGWQKLLTEHGLTVFASGVLPPMSCTYPLSDSGIVLGVLFRRNVDPCCETFERVTTLSAYETSAILRDGPCWLVDNMWGWYVALVKSPLHSSTWVMRGPMSDLHCHELKFGGATIFASKTEDFVSLRLCQFNIEWAMLQVAVGFGYPAPLGQSAIREIHTLQSGEVSEFKCGSTTRRLVWDPRAIARQPHNYDQVTTGRALKATMRSCIHAWASLHPRIVHRLSGGLDSSVVLQCLSNAPSAPEITNINYYWERKQFDERVLARAISSHTRTTLIERRLGTERKLDVIRDVARTSAPVMDVVDWQMHISERELVAETGATAISGGWLGDSLFERDVSLGAALDYAHVHGINKRFFTIALDLAVRNSVSIWGVLLTAARMHFKPPNKAYWSIHEESLRNGLLSLNHLLVDEAKSSQFLNNVAMYIHPWLRDIEGVPESKLWQISTLFVEGFYDAHFRRADDAPIIAPLSSQPLAELCLRTPSYWNAMRGGERTMLRFAFESEMPSVILRRFAKGTPDCWLVEMIERDREFVRE